MNPALNESPKVRALNLERQIEHLIESGEFTPEYGYLTFDTKLGPCGCVLAASAVAAGETRSNLFYQTLRQIVEDAGFATQSETRSLENAYERRNNLFDNLLNPEFFKAGERLRRFHP